MVKASAIDVDKIGDEMCVVVEDDPMRLEFPNSELCVPAPARRVRPAAVARRTTLLITSAGPVVTRGHASLVNCRLY